MMTKTFGEPGTGVIGPTMSALTFIPPLPRDDHGIGAIVRHNVMERKLESAYQSLLDSGYVTIDRQDGRELWRISLRVAAFEDVDYGVFTDSLKAAIDPVVERHSRPRGGGAVAGIAPGPVVEPDINAIYTGVVPIVYKAQTALLKSLVSSTIWSFMTITPLLMFVARGFLAGLVAMIPNVLPVVVVFGGLSWLGWAIDIGSMMAASIALGVAVDDTIHYLTWYRVSLNRDGNRKNAILSAYHHCATPTMQATVINGLGLSVFTISTFAPTRQFGLLMLVILFAGAVAELLLLPAILAGPLGRVFKPKAQSSDEFGPNP
jgi:predicted RND superfamily exporter protein